jgi:hypothetical protein
MSGKFGRVLLKPVAILTAATVCLILQSVSGAAHSLLLPDGSKLDLEQRCPVGGMVIGGKDGQGATITYKEGRVVGFAGAAAAVSKEGHAVGFEGARCLFIYKSVLQKYGIDVRDIKSQLATDFASRKMIDLPKGFLVLGSDVKGPIGFELIALSTKEEAEISMRK